MRIWARALLLAFLPVLAGGCSLPKGYRIEEIQNILVAGLDAEGEEISLTVLVDTIEQGGEAGQKTIGQKLYTAAGKTVFEALRNLYGYTDRHVSLFHLQYIVIGEEAARQGIDRYLSFFCEDDETTLLHALIIARGTTARGFLQRTASVDSQYVDKLNALFSEAPLTGKSRETELLEYAISRKRPWIDLRIPIVTLMTDPIPQNEGEQGNASFRLEGYGLFREDALAGFLDGSLARGVNFITDEIREAVLTVVNLNGRYAALEIMKSRAVITPKYGDPLSAAITLTVTSNLTEYEGDGDLMRDEYILDLERQQNALIRQEVERALAALQQCGTDVIGLGDAFYHADPAAWREIKERWTDIFSGIDISVEVKSKVQCVYTMINAPGGEGEGTR